MGKEILRIDGMGMKFACKTRNLVPLLVDQNVSFDWHGSFSEPPSHRNDWLQPLKSATDTLHPKPAGAPARDETSD